MVNNLEQAEEERDMYN
jgi:chromosome segregation ATPase